MARQALGRGLSALLGEEKKNLGIEEGLTELDLDVLVPNSQQPRDNFEEAELLELAQSIRSNGVVQPILVRKRRGGYQIVAGERRWRAAQRAELKKIPALVRDISDEKLLEIALIENIQREELNPVEEARAYKKLLDSYGLTQEEVAKRVGKTRPFIANYLRLLKLPDFVLSLLEKRKLSVGHARALLAITDQGALRRLTNRILKNGLSVRETESAVQRLTRVGARKGARKTSKRTDPNIKSAESKLRRKYATHVKIVPSGSRGRIEFEYYGEADLNRIYDLLMGK